MLKSCVVVDVDGTLAEFDPASVEKWVLGEEKHWDDFFNYMEDALPVNNIVTLVNKLSDSGEHIVICSGRPDSHRQHTINWLERHSIPYDEVYLRPLNADHVPDETVKHALLDAIREDGYQPWLVLDDRTAVVDFWRQQGLTCLQVAPGDF